jgi:hypothetical protein
MADISEMGTAFAGAAVRDERCNPSQLIFTHLPSTALPASELPNSRAKISKTKKCENRQKD